MAPPGSTGAARETAFSAAPKRPQTRPMGAAERGSCAMMGPAMGPSMRHPSRWAQSEGWRPLGAQRGRKQGRGRLRFAEQALSLAPFVHPNSAVGGKRLRGSAPSQTRQRRSGARKSLAPFMGLLWDTPVRPRRIASSETQRRHKYGNGAAERGSRWPHLWDFYGTPRFGARRMASSEAQRRHKHGDGAAERGRRWPHLSNSYGTPRLCGLRTASCDAAPIGQGYRSRRRAGESS